MSLCQTILCRQSRCSHGIGINAKMLSPILLLLHGTHLGFLNQRPALHQLGDLGAADIPHDAHATPSCVSLSGLTVLYTNCKRGSQARCSWLTCWPLDNVCYHKSHCSQIDRIVAILPIVTYAKPCQQSYGDSSAIFAGSRVVQRAELRFGTNNTDSVSC